MSASTARGWRRISRERRWPMRFIPSEMTASARAGFDVKWWYTAPLPTPECPVMISKVVFTYPFRSNSSAARCNTLFRVTRARC